VLRPPDAWRERADQLLKDLLVEFTCNGSASGYQLEQRFAFEAPDVREAVELASELRKIVHNGVQVRPCPLRLLARRRWTVTATTPRIPVLEAVPDVWREQVVSAAERRPQCTLVSWEPVVRAVP
jgi:hypothetical protein